MREDANQTPSRLLSGLLPPFLLLLSLTFPSRISKGSETKSIFIVSAFRWCLIFFMNRAEGRLTCPSGRNLPPSFSPTLLSVSLNNHQHPTPPSPFVDGFYLYARLLFSTLLDERLYDREEGWSWHDQEAAGRRRSSEVWKSEGQEGRRRCKFFTYLFSTSPCETQGECSFAILESEEA